MAVSVRYCVTAGFVVAGAGFWLAATTESAAPTVRTEVQLTSVASTPAPPLAPPSAPRADCGGDPLCVLSANPPKLAAALTPTAGPPAPATETVAAQPPASDSSGS
jgi:hypothetical protein